MIQNKAYDDHLNICLLVYDFLFDIKKNNKQIQLHLIITEKIHICIMIVLISEISFLNIGLLRTSVVIYRDKIRVH
jgi:hypothetical protein